MKKLVNIGFLLLVIGVAGYMQYQEPLNGAGQTSQASHDNSVIHNAYKNQKSDVQVQGLGRVVKVLKDDNKGSRHQRFILDVGFEKTILIAHNIDLAPRVAPINRGDIIEFYGEYEWNQKGGVVHWTHHDPRGRHVGGWLSSNGEVFQ